MGRDVDHPRERVEPFDTFGPPDRADQAFSRFMAASGGPAGSDYETAEIPVHRWRAPRLSRLDILWLFLASGLVVAVVFVVSMARTSMNDVGVTASAGPAALPKKTAAPVTLVIVQVSSSASRDTAQSSVKDLTGRGFAAKVLKSDGYRPLNKGFYVVYTGFYPDTADGRAAARKVQSKLPGSLVRDIHPR
jgi:hypothetical protein